MTTSHRTEMWILPKVRLDDLIRLLLQEGFEVIGPRIEQQAIVYGAIQSTKDLPVGWTDRQTPGSYRLEKRQDGAYFGYAVGPHSWKKYLFPPTLRLWQARRTDVGFEVHDAMPDPPRRALLGVRACELHALAVHDKVFLDRAGQFTDPHYATVRVGLFLVAVECEHPGGTCFCASMGTGPEIRDEWRVMSDEKDRADVDDSSPRQPLPLVTRPSSLVPIFFDLVLMELDEAFVARPGSVAGRGLIDRLGLAAASAEQGDEGRRRVAAGAEKMGRSLDVTDIRNLLHRNQEHPRWDDVADAACLAPTARSSVRPAFAPVWKTRPT